MIGFGWDAESACTYLSEDDRQAGCESGHDSELEEMELALYNQIHYHQSFMADELCESRSTFPSESFVLVGPGGDNSGGKPACDEASQVIVTNWEANSICQAKVDSTILHWPDKIDQLVTIVNGRVKRKRATSDLNENEDSNGGKHEDTVSDSSEYSFVGQISSDSQDSCQEDSVLMDLQLNLIQESGMCEDNSTLAEDKDSGQNWSLIDEDMLPQGSGSMPARYYRPGHVKPLNVRCLNCNELGHLSKACPRPKKHLICYLCGETGHNMRSCPRSICYNCEAAAGHTARECPLTRKRHWEICHRCHMQGHRQSECPQHWRQYHVTTDGRLSKLKLKRNPRVYCHNCGLKGHFGYECTESPATAHSQPVYPFIVKYEEYKPHAANNSKRRDDKMSGHTGPSRKKQKLDNHGSGKTTELSAHVKHGAKCSTKASSGRRRKPDEEQKIIRHVTCSINNERAKCKKATERKMSKKRKKKNEKGRNSRNKIDDPEMGGFYKTKVKNRKKKSKNKVINDSGKTGSQMAQTDRGFNIVLKNVKFKLYD